MPKTKQKPSKLMALKNDKELAEAFEKIATAFELISEATIKITTKKSEELLIKVDNQIKQKGEKTLYELNLKIEVPTELLNQ